MDIVALPYSIGTTGLPKGVMLSHRNIVINILQVDASGHLLREDNIRVGFFEPDQYEAVLAHLPEAMRPVVTFAYVTHPAAVLAAFHTISGERPPATWAGLR